MTNQLGPKTKTERIRELLIAGRPPKEVADKMDTSREYVYKEKGKLKREGLLVEHQSLSISEGSKGITIVRDKDDVENYFDYPYGPIDDVNHAFVERDIKPLDQKGLMSMYGAFRENMNPSEVIAKFGIRPDISQREHQRYLIMNSRDPFVLQNKIASEITNAPPEIQSIVEKSKTALLTNDEILSLIKFKEARYAQYYVKIAVLNNAIRLPTGIERPMCRYCNAPQPGVLFDRSSYQGSFVQKSVIISCCPTCKIIYDRVYIEFNQKT